MTKEPEMIDRPEKNAGFRKLLEAKDCLVRAALVLLVALSLAPSAWALTRNAPVSLPSAIIATSSGTAAAIDVSLLARPDGFVVAWIPNGGDTGTVDVSIEHSPDNGTTWFPLVSFPAGGGTLAQTLDYSGPYFGLIRMVWSSNVGGAKLPTFWLE